MRTVVYRDKDGKRFQSYNLGPADSFEVRAVLDDRDKIVTLFAHYTSGRIRNYTEGYCGTSVPSTWTAVQQDPDLIIDVGL